MFRDQVAMGRIPGVLERERSLKPRNSPGTKLPAPDVYHRGDRAAVKGGEALRVRGPVRRALVRDQAAHPGRTPCAGKNAMGPPAAACVGPRIASARDDRAREIQNARSGALLRSSPSAGTASRSRSAVILARTASVCVKVDVSSTTPPDQVMHPRRVLCGSHPRAGAGPPRLGASRIAQDGEPTRGASHMR